MRTRALYSWMLAVFAGLALILALGGTYGVTSYLVTQRTREIGIRMAMGAGVSDIVRSVLRGSLTAILVGLALGLAAVVGLARLLGDMLFGVPPHDPVILADCGGDGGHSRNWLPARAQPDRSDGVAEGLKTGSARRTDRRWSIVIRGLNVFGVPSLMLFLIAFSSSSIAPRP